MRKYIREKLTGDYEVVEAKDGHEGLAIAKERIPDLVISDVMATTKWTDFELCTLLKTDNHTSHIPVILLTMHDADKLSGLKPVLMLI